MVDAELLEKLRTEPNEGLRLLVREYEALLYSVVRGVLKNSSEQDIEECVSDAFTDFYFALSSYDGSVGSIKAYLCVAAKNKALNILRAGARRASVALEDIEEPADADGSTEEIYMRRDRVRELARMVKGLGQPDCEIIFRKYYLKQTSETIASALGMTEGNVNVRTHRALKKLRKCIEN